MKRAFLLCLTVVLFIAACDATPMTPEVVQPEFVTVTLPPSQTPAAKHTPLPPTTAPTVAPASGTTTSEINVRSEPSTAGAPLGVVPIFSTIQITGKDTSGNWYQIIFNNGTGWVRADFVQVDVPAEIPVADADSASGSGMRGVVTGGVNVRAGPGREFESLGLLNQYDVVNILGKDASGAWLEIEYVASKDGTGWVAAEYLRVENAEAIPVVAHGTADGTAAPSAVYVAVLDGDSAENPLNAFELSPESARVIQFKGEISTPEGDGEDWLQFSSQAVEIVAQVTCVSGRVRVEVRAVMGHSQPMELNCGEERVLPVKPGTLYRMRIVPQTGNGTAVMRYEIRLRLIG